jgi:hypothetical protein
MHRWMPLLAAIGLLVTVPGVAAAAPAHGPLYVQGGVVATAPGYPTYITKVDARGVVYGYSYLENHHSSSPYLVRNGKLTTFTPDYSVSVDTYLVDADDRGIAVGYRWSDQSFSEQLPMRWVWGKESPLPLPADFRGSAIAVNNRGDVLLQKLVAGEPSLWLLTSDGKLTVIDPRGYYRLASAGRPHLDDARRVVTTGLDQKYVEHALILSRGTVTDLGPGTEVRATGPGGLVVGVVATSDGDQRGFRWRDGKLSGLAPAAPAARWVNPTAVNAAGVVVGYADDPAGRSVPQRWDAEGAHALPTPDQGQGQAWAVNAGDRAAGAYRDPEAARDHAVAWQGTTRIELPDPSGTLNVSTDSGVALGPDGSVFGIVYLLDHPDAVLYRWKIQHRPFS